MFNERTFGYHRSWRSRERQSELPLLHLDRSALLWVRNSAEYAALCQQVFTTAIDIIKDLAKRSQELQSSRKPLAVVLDLDETVLDNSNFNLALIRQSLDYSEGLWRDWEVRHGDSVSLVPGFEKFLCEFAPTDRCPRREDDSTTPIELVFISNRTEVNAEATFETLKRLKVVAPETDFETYKQSHLFLKAENGSKADRRAAVKERYEILAYFGDNLADFAEEYEYRKATGVSSRRDRAIGEDREKWGVTWFVLPNPVYGDWKDHLTEREIRAIIDSSVWLREMEANEEESANAKQPESLPAPTSTGKQME
jgi:5'-nucleotidase (lipoprotein e(P4) family)